MKNYITLFIKGIFIGVANVIPGVSGGTIALVLNVFDGLIDAINNFFKEPKKHLSLIIPLGLGAVAGILAFSSLINFLLADYSFPTVIFFLGLVVGSLPLICNKALSKGFRPVYILPAAAALGAVVFMSVIKAPDSAAAESAVSAGLMAKLFFGGVVAAAAMVVPGISGSFMMVLFGLYTVIISAIADIGVYLTDPGNTELLISIIKICVPLGLGIVIGIVLISRLIAVLMEKYYSITYFTILGLMLGSIFGLLNDPATYASGTELFMIVAAAVTFAVGFFGAFFLGRE